MVKVMAVVRTAVLATLLGWMLSALPLGVIFFGGEVKERNTFALADLTRVAAVGWAAIGWIALETTLGWSKTWYQARQRRKELEQAAARAIAEAASAKKGP